MGFNLFPKNLTHWKVVVVSFLAATTFWFFNSLNKNYTTSLKYPVNFSYNQDSLISVKQLPSSIELDVSGGGWNLLRKTALFSPEPLNIELSDFVSKSTLSWLEMLPSIRDQIKDLNVNQVLQDTLNVQIEPLASKWLTPQIDSLLINLESGYRIVSNIEVEEDSIRITGPKSFIDDLNSEFIIQIQETGIDRDFDDPVPIIQNTQLLTAYPEEVLPKFSVAKFNQLQIEIGLELNNFPDDSSAYLETETVQINFTVQESLQQNYLTQDFIVIADYSMIRSSDSTVMAIVTGYPMEVSEIAVSPEVVKVHFR